MNKRVLPGEAPPAPNKGGAKSGGFTTPQSSGSPIIGGGGGLSWQAAQRVLYALLAASLALSVLFGVRVPLDNNPDEAAHRDYIRLLLRDRALVRFAPDDPANPRPPGEPSRFETHQPPLYYLLCAPVHAATGGSVPAVRLVAALFQLATIAAVFLACRDLFPTRPDWAIGASAFAAFLPTQAQLGAAINNDALTTLLCTILLWRMGVIVAKGQNSRAAVVSGIVLGIGLLTKLSILQLLPALVVAYALAVRANRLTARDAVINFALTFGVGVLLASPWLVRNTILYGDPLTLGIYRLTGPNFTPEQISGAAKWSMTDYARNVGVRSFATFWYFLSPSLRFNVFTGPPLPLLLVVVLGLGGAFGAYRWGKISTATADDADDGARRVVLLYAAAVALLVPFFTRFVLTVFQAQGRYFLPVLLPVAVVATIGWSSLLSDDRRAVWAALAVPVLLLGLALYQMGRGGYLFG